MEDVYHDTALECILQLTEGPYDSMIECGDMSRPVHKSLLSVHSPYFRAAFRRGRFKEGETGTIKLKAVGEGEEGEENLDDPEIIGQLIDYCYHMAYSYRPPESYIERPITYHAKVFAAAIKYQVSGLATLATSWFKDASLLGNISQNDLGNATEVVYTSTPDTIRTLRDFIVKIIDDNDILDGFPADSPLVQMVETLPDLCWDIMRYDHGIDTNSLFPGVSKRMRWKRREEDGQINAWRLNHAIINL